MNKEQKAAQVEEIAATLGEAQAIFAIDYRGISVPQAAELRARLAEADAVLRIVKNRLAKRAAEKAGVPELDELLEGPTALTLIAGDPVTAAKAISTFSRQNNVLEYKGGLMEGAPLDPDAFTTIARLPALDVLHGQVVAMTASPLTGLARGLGAMLSGLTVALGEIKDKGLVSGEEPATEEPAAEVAGKEAPAETADGESPEEEQSETSNDTQPDESPEEAEAEGEASEGDASEESEAPAEDSEEEESSGD